jgi:hypothetical protein
MDKSSPYMRATCVNFKIRTKVNNNTIGLNSHNLVTLPSPKAEIIYSTCMQQKCHLSCAAQQLMG